MSRPIGAAWWRQSADGEGYFSVSFHLGVLGELSCAFLANHHRDPDDPACRRPHYHIVHTVPHTDTRCYIGGVWHKTARSGRPYLFGRLEPAELDEYAPPGFDPTTAPTVRFCLFAVPHRPSERAPSHTILRAHG